MRDTMRGAMRAGISILALLAFAGAGAAGQAVPAGPVGVSSTPAAIAGTGSGFSLPITDGLWHYALGASQMEQYGYYGPSRWTGTAALNGDLGYSSGSAKAPFNMMYAGGVLISESSGVNTTTYQNMAVSQGLMRGRWVFNLADSVSYMPQSPIGGFSGIPGAGDVGTVPNGGTGLGPTGGLLTYSGPRVGNGLSGSAELLLTGKTSASARGSWEILHFLDGDADGYDTQDTSGEVALNHRIDARDTVAVNAVYSLFTFGKNEGGLNFETRGIDLVYSRLVSPSISVDISAGPQWLSSSDKALIPNSLNAAASVGLSYARGLSNARIGYSRGVNGGYGVQYGGLSDTVTASAGHGFGRTWQAGVNMAYMHTESLTQTGATPPPGLSIPLGGSFSTVFGGAQLSHRLSRSLSAYVTYAAQHQSYNTAYTGTNAFNGTSQTFAIGITYAPRSLRLGQF